MHKNVKLRSDKQASAQGSVFFIIQDEQHEMILKSVSGQIVWLAGWPGLGMDGTSFRMGSNAFFCLVLRAV